MGRELFFVVALFPLLVQTTASAYIGNELSDVNYDEHLASGDDSFENVYPNSDTPGNITERVEEMALSADAVQIFLDAIENVVMENEDFITIPADIDPEQHNISLEDAFSRLNEFLTEQMEEAQNLYAEIENMIEGVGAAQSTMEYMSFQKKNSSYDATELETYKGKVLDIMEVITGATEDLSDYLRSKSTSDYDYYDEDFTAENQDEAMDKLFSTINRSPSQKISPENSDSFDFDHNSVNSYENPSTELTTARFSEDRNDPSEDSSDDGEYFENLMRDTPSENMDNFDFDKPLTTQTTPLAPFPSTLVTQTTTAAPFFVDESDQSGDGFVKYDDSFLDNLPAENIPAWLSNFPTYPSFKYNDFDTFDNSFDSDDDFDSESYNSYSDDGNSSVAVGLAVPASIVFFVLIVWLRITRCRRATRTMTVIRRRTIQVPVARQVTRVAVIGICETATRSTPQPNNAGLPSYLDVVSKNVDPPPPCYESCTTRGLESPTEGPPPPDYSDNMENETSDVARLIPIEDV